MDDSNLPPSVFSPGSDRDNKELRELWKPILDEYKVDLVLSGHDHTYARTGQVDTQDLKNVPSGYQQAYDPNIGTVYVVSVSGPKMYGIPKETTQNEWLKIHSCIRLFTLTIKI